MLATALVLGTAAPGAADPKPTQPKPTQPKPTEKQLKKELSGLRKKVDRLIGDYNAKRVTLAEARVAEKAARDRLAKAQANYDAGLSEVRRYVGLRYQADSAMLLPDMSTAALNHQLKEEQAARLARFDQLRVERQRAAETAKALTTRLKTQTTEVAARREDAEDLIEKIKERIDALIPTAPGKRAGGSWAPELPSGSDNITARMRLMRAEVGEHFDLRFPVGCYRSDTSGEHPLGRACDFMMSSGGSMPSAEMKALGDSLAAWAIKNGPKLGVMYVIWQQRIYHLGRPGWRTMSDRGGITANHYDHVHISMY